MDLKEILNETAKDLDHNKISIYFECLSDDSKAVTWNEDHYYHPASLIKLFASQMAYELLLPSNETNRAIQESLKESDNDALSSLVDMVTGTQSGAELEGKEFRNFEQMRNTINDFFIRKGCTEKFNIPNKCFSFDAYGRDKQLCEKSPNRVSVLDVALIMKLIKSQNQDENCIYGFLQRDLSNKKDYQSQSFIANGIRDHIDKDSEVYSKAGWTSKARHDAACFSIGGKEYLLIMLTEALSHKEELISDLGNSICALALEVASHS